MNLWCMGEAQSRTYVLIGSSSSFGTGAALILPIQVLLNNLLYDVSEIAIAFDRADPEATALPMRWRIKLIGVHAGWFIGSVTTQAFVVIMIVRGYEVPERAAQTACSHGPWVCRHRDHLSVSPSGPVVRFRVAAAVLRLFRRRDGCLFDIR